MKEYCTYLTIYFGDLLPRRYIGSTSIERIEKGYNGSLKSKKYKSIYESEQNNNKKLFKTRILKTFYNREDALIEEKRLHLKYDAVKNESYMNMSIACPEGFFGRSQFGKDHPLYGKTHSDETKTKISESLKAKYASGEITSPFKDYDVKGENNPFYGKTHSDETKAKMSKPKKYVPKWQCPFCKKDYDGGNFVQHMKRKHDWTKEKSIKFKEE